MKAIKKYGQIPYFDDPFGKMCCVKGIKNFLFGFCSDKYGSPLKDGRQRKTGWARTDALQASIVLTFSLGVHMNIISLRDKISPLAFSLSAGLRNFTGNCTH